MTILDRLQNRARSIFTSRTHSDKHISSPAEDWLRRWFFRILPPHILSVFTRNKAMSLSAELLLSIALYVILLIVFIFLFFPRQALERRIEAEILRSSQGMVSVNTLHVTPSFAFKADEVLFPLKAGGFDGGVLKIDNASGYLHRLRLLFGTVMLTAKGSLGGGSILVNVRRLDDPKDWNFNISSTGINIDVLDELLAPVRCVGLAAIEGTAALSGNKLTSAQMSLTLNNVTINGLVVQNFTIDKARADSISLSAELDDGVITVEQCSIVGPDIDAEFEGTISVRTPFENSQLKITMGIRPTLEFLEKNELTFLRGFLASQGSGMVSLPVRGSIKSPRIDFMSLAQPPR